MLALIIEDNKIALKMAEAALSTLSIECHGVETGQAAIEAMQSTQYDLIFVDIGLPDMDGFDILTKMQEERLQSEAYVVVLTGHAEEEYRQRAFALEADEFLVKPFSFGTAKELYARLTASN